MINRLEHIKSNEIKWNSRSRSYDFKIFDYFRWMQKHLINQMDIKQNANFLDLGCGTGWAVCHIAQKLKYEGNFVGVDISEGMLNKARKKTNGYKNVSFIKLSTDELPFENESFDFVICTNSFHHYPNPQKTILEINRILKTNGLVYILDVTNDNFLSNLLDYYFRKTEKEHMRFYNSKEYIKMFFSVGLKNKMSKKFAYIFKIHTAKKIAASRYD